MALVKCRECGRDVSTSAVACPGCGGPIASAAVRAPVHTIEKTAKSLKGRLLLSALMMVVGIICCIAGICGAKALLAVGGILMLIGFVWRIITKIRIWWHHA